MTVEVGEKIHDIRDDLAKLEFDSVGNVFIGWWFNPVKDLIADPLLGVAENIVPKVTSVVPFSDNIVGFGLDVTSTVGHAFHGVGSHVGIFKGDPSTTTRMQGTASEEFREFFFGGVSLVQTSIAFGTGAVVDVFSTLFNQEKLSRWFGTLNGIYKYLEASGIGKEVLKGVSLQNLIILGKAQAMTRDIKSDKIASPEECGEGYYFMKYATAAYGAKTISAVNNQKMGAKLRVSRYSNSTNPGTNFASEADISEDIQNMYLVDEPIEFENRAEIAAHIGVPENDIVMFVKPGGNMKVVRHFIAVDHLKKAVVLAIRGTFSVSELLVDATAETRDFCGGKAHSGIADIADELWNVCGDVVQSALEANPGYGLVLTGHSLGAGAACLLNIKLYHENLVNTKVFCFAFASPAVFDDLDAAPQAVANTIAFIHDDDSVPFMSFGNLRELTESLMIVDKHKGNLFDQIQVILGKKDPSPELVKAVEHSAVTTRSGIEGAEKSYIPAFQVVWMRGSTDDGYTAYEFEAKDLPEIYIDVDIINDHFPPYYEESLLTLIN
mmetsp:Transcript_5888/g.7230  ORF Transcript_5888/g.7230 Transcript_5888/m.7230 type:complete len:552 (-) Transcript_5888:222-1877(-)|eukprot:CAMPEP_0195276212 /NCGR_PEP_ID=MMETSP0706-20130129/18393_1 /TAXON_ID=33640 /ORGANISM="Asterionellopsis glacialis, Strain CCMP134" /LENGTH=551 /DNA_ID=CAMNT_0040333795 /DNA_START=56 /DNA_END=1711 /DNA_ORIENTATION=-